MATQVQKVDQIARLTFFEFDASTSISAGTVKRDMQGEITFLDLLENEVLMMQYEQGVAFSTETVTTTTKAAAWNWDDGTKWNLAEWG